MLKGCIFSAMRVADSLGVDVPGDQSCQASHQMLQFRKSIELAGTLTIQVFAACLIVVTDFSAFACPWSLSTFPHSHNLERESNTKTHQPCQLCRHQCAPPFQIFAGIPANHPHEEFNYRKIEENQWTPSDCKVFPCDTFQAFKLK